MTTLATTRDADRAVGARRPVGLAPALAGLGVAVVVSAAASILVGAEPIRPSAVLDVTDPEHAIAVARLPRTALALAVGAALGLAGACLQGMTRNPLADPGILGIHAGASFAMVLAISLFGIGSLSAYVWFAFVGAAAAMALVHAVASIGREGATPAKLAIAGAALTAGLSSWTSAVLLTDRQTLDVFRFWQVGTVGGRGFDVLVLGAPFLLVGAVLALTSTRLLNALALGDDLARGLGRRLVRDRLVLGAAVVLLAGTATALAGPIAFVGLIVPHAVRAIAGPDYTRVLPLSVGYGAALVTLADTVGRVVLPPTEVQVGIMTAVVGVPAFLWLVRRGRTAAP